MTETLIVLSNVGIVVVTLTAIILDHHTVNLFARLLYRLTKGRRGTIERDIERDAAEMRELRKLEEIDKRREEGGK